MNKALIVEDDTVQARLLLDTIQESFPNWQLSYAPSYPEAQKLLRESLQTEEYYSLFLLDIQLSNEPDDRGGFLLAKELRTYKPYYRAPILFLTVLSNEQSIALTHFHCYNYLAKPYKLEDIIYQLRQMQITGYFEHELIALFDTNHIRHRVPLSTINYGMAQSHIVTLYTDNGKIVTRDYSLEALCNEFPEQLVRCHRKYVIHIAKVTNYDRLTHMIHINQIPIPVGRKYIPLLNNCLLPPSN